MTRRPLFADKLSPEPHGVHVQRGADDLSFSHSARPTRIRHRAAMILMLMWAVAFARAQDSPRPLTLEDCLRSGLVGSVAVANAARDRAAAEAVISEMRSSLLPDLVTQAHYLRRDELDSFQFDGPPITLGRLDNYSAGITLRQLVYDGGSVAAALAAARSYRERMALQAERVRETLARDIHLAFYGVCYLEEAVRVQAATITQLNDLAEEMERKHREGMVAEFDAMSACVRAANEQPVLAAIERERKVARASFRNLARLDRDDFELRPDHERTEQTADLLDAADAIRLALSERRELQEQHKLIELRAADVRAERSRYAPTVRAYGSYDGRNPESFISSEDRWDWGWEVGLSFEWTLFDGGQRAARVRQKELALLSARADLEDLERRLRLEVEEAWMRREEARQAMKAAEQTVGLAERSLEIARARLEAGLITQLEFTDATLALRRARLLWLAAQRDVRSADVQLAYVVGRSLVPASE